MGRRVMVTGGVMMISRRSFRIVVRRVQLAGVMTLAGQEAG
jgi:hypothetical protein